VAEALGYRNGSVRATTERFMRDYYTHARNIHLITRTLEERLALQPKSNSSFIERLGKAIPRPSLPFRRRMPVEFDGFKIQHGQLQLVHRRVLRDNPVRVMRAFRIAQQRGLTLHPDLVQVIRRQVGSLVDHTFRADPHVHTAFIEILNSVGNVSATLRAMHEVGVLGAFLPEFGALTNLVQHEYFHRFATDEHTLVCLEKLDRLQEAKELPFDRYTEILRRLERPWVLHLALLLHDVGKAVDTPNHSEVGGELVLKVAKRLNLDGATTHTLRLIIEQHLAMPRLWQTRDLDDPEVIRAFCATIQSQENLELLTLHTVADSLGTSQDLWKDFHHNQHWTLYSKAAAFFRDGVVGRQIEEKERELLQEEVRRLLPKTFDPDELRAHFEGLPPRYFHIHNAVDITRDLVLAHQFMHLQIMEVDRALEPVVYWQDRRLPLARNLPADTYEKDRGYAMVQVCTWDRAGLFSKITGALAAASLNIFGAQVFTRTDGIVLDTFYVADARTGELPTADSRQRFEKILLQVLTGDFALGPAIARTKRFRPPWQGLAGDTIATEIRFHNDVAGSTVIEVVAEDRVGLLYAISHALSELDLNLRLAKIVTERGAAIDSFYVTEIDGTKVTSEGRQRWIEQRVRGAIAALE
jgi:[protein-PII] uridylyltransferase